ncbi:interleukin-12 receptor subunit beta-2 [Thunnus maccoyii]|uniref:interleukin-12 receptor subunit beta-2 n=1 Tax=Thunnus maccoyii TaxID=8240 RepID=UPI001C4B2D5A|nr:interleukin-12 receptor subunit beta-2 [Thunnus maccoyii]
MATMSQTWSILTVVTVLAVQLCIGEKSCVIWSSNGPVVQRGSSFNVYCTFNCECKRSMYSDHPPTPQKHIQFNSTTIHFNVVNITKNRTFSCECKCSHPPILDPCGLDISAGYPPDRAKNLSCIYKVLNNESGVVVCTWNRGRKTYLRNTAVLWVRTVSGSHIGTPQSYNVSSKETDSASANFTVSSSVQSISVWVQTSNLLDTVVSDTINYTLSDIAMPLTPVLWLPECSSRECVIKVEQPVGTQHLEIQYRTEQQMWTTNPDSGVKMSLVQVQPVSSLEPYRLYHFRARSKFSTGLWSQWSTNISSWTQEEAPAKELDVWFAKSDSDSKSLTVYWKDIDISIARGKIIDYIVRVTNSGLNYNISAQARNYSVPFYDNCEVTVYARNSKGLSPPARITTCFTKAKPPQDVRVTKHNPNVTISWSKPETTPLPAAYVVEWYPDGHKLEELRWVRLGGNDNHAVITGVQPFKCYEGAVYVLYHDNSMTRTSFTGVYTMESIPTAGPSVEEKVEGDAVKVNWTELPRGQRRGCITKYTIYLENSSGHQQSYSVQASERTHTFKGLSPAVYSLCMTASTAQGESPKGQKIKFVIQQHTQLLLILVCAVLFLIVVVLLCLCQSSAVKQRFWVFFQCLMLDVVPDPANSKWAKECTQEKGRMNLPPQLRNSSVTEEDEPILVDVEELPQQSSDISAPTNVSSQLLPQTSQSSETEPATLLYPLTTYIKSFSHDSDSSNHTQTSLDTNTTVGYISSHGNMEEDNQEEVEEAAEEEFAEVLGFFPSHNVFMEPLVLGGKLTLDAVKIDCSNFFQNS